MAYMKFQDYRNVDYRIQRLLASNGQDSDQALMDHHDVENGISEIVY